MWYDCVMIYEMMWYFCCNVYYNLMLLLVEDYCEDYCGGGIFVMVSGWFGLKIDTGV